MSKVCPKHNRELRHSVIDGVSQYSCQECGRETMAAFVPVSDPAAQRNARVAARWDQLTREGKHGHYETLFRVVREEVERAISNPQR